MLMVPGKLGFHVHLNRDRYVVLKQPKYPAVALNLRHHHGKWHSRVLVVRSTAERGAVVIENDPGAAAVCRHRGWEQ